MSKICVAYCRVSTDSAEQAESFENQKTYFNREIEKNIDYKLAGVYADRGISGTKLSRPEFDRMIYDAGLDIIEVKNADADNRKSMKKYITIPSTTRKPKFNLILVKNTARFARNVLVEDILRDLVKVGVYVKFLDLNKSTEQQEDIIFLQMFQIFDEGESRKKSTAVRFGQKEGALRGKINASSKLYGYTYNQPQNRLDIIEFESIIIRKIFSMYADGMGIRRIINDLTSADILTRDGKPFCKSSIRRILTNEKYAGINVRMKYNTGIIFNKNSYAKINPKNEWLIVDTDKIPAIVSEELFYQCEQILGGRVNHTNQVGIYKGTTEYAGLIYCGVCGASYNSNIDRGRRYYNCSTKKRDGIKACNGRNISLTALEDILTPDVYTNAKGIGIQSARTALTVIKEQYTESLTNIPQAKIEQLQAGIDSIKSEEDNLLRVYIKGIIKESEFEAVKIPLSTQRQQLEIELQGLTMPKDETLQAIADIDSALSRINDIDFKMEYTRGEMLLGIDKIIVQHGNRLQIKFKVFINETKVKMDDILVTIDY